MESKRRIPEALVCVVILSVGISLLIPVQIGANRGLRHLNAS